MSTRQSRQSGQYWVKIAWPTATSGYVWRVASYTAKVNGDKGLWFFDGMRDDKEILEVDENRLVYNPVPPQPKEYDWDPSDHDDPLWAISKRLLNIGMILQDIHQQLQISNLKR